VCGLSPLPVVHRSAQLMLKPALQLKFGQRQAMTPQLQQAIRLLQLSAVELQQLVREALAENVMLDLEEDSDELTLPSVTETAALPAEPKIAEADTDPTSDPWADSHTKTGAADSAWSEDEGSTEYADLTHESLQEHLLGQLSLIRLTGRDLAIGRAIIDSINDDGYLLDPLDSVVAALRPEVDAQVTDVEAVLRKIQTFDPAGVGARSVGECIELQLAQLDPHTPGLLTAIEAVREHLPAVAAGEQATLRRALEVSTDELADALALIRASHPRPGSAYHPRLPEFVVPDVVVKRKGRHWHVELNGGAVPRLKINSEYAPLVSREHAAMRAQLQEARWLIKSVEMRNDTLLKVARAIVSRQNAFFENGDEAMEPLVLREVAEAVDMHESTISRVTTGKYMLTPRGMYELRHFFSSHVAAADGTEVSSTAIRAKIKKLIAGESADNPLSDSRIAELLAADGAKVARRTVAKYREAMKIAPSSERRAALGR
jgi:RNA polymerase sigma-54 factor